MIPSSAVIASSKRRKPRDCSPRIANAITPVMQPGRQQRHPEQQVQADRRAEELGDVGRHRHHLGLQPHAPRDRPGVVRAHVLRQVAVGDDAQLGREVLDQHRHQVRREHHPQQQVAELAPRPGCWWRSCPGRRRRPPRRTPGRASPASRAAGLWRAAVRVRWARLARRSVTAAPSLPSSTGTGAGRGVNAGLSRPRLRIARARRVAERVGALAEAHEQRPAERLAVDDLELVADRDALLGQVAQHLRVGVRDAHEAPAGTDRQLVQAAGLALLQVERRRRDRVAVRVDRRVAELRGDQLLEVVGEDVLEHLGLGVHAVPRHPQHLGQVALEQAVVADHLERDAPSGRR